MSANAVIGSSAATGLVSGEGVRLDLVPAGVGSRTIAAAVDVTVQLILVIVFLIVDVNLAAGTDLAAFTAIVVLEGVVVLAGYPIVMEWTTRGRTLGKLWLGLRVVRDDGGPIGFRQALVRGLAGLILEKPGLAMPFSTVAALLTMTVSTRDKRIGDMMAGTVVLNERAASARALAVPALWIPPPLWPWAQALDLHRLDDRLALGVRQFVTRAYAMSPAARYALGEDLRWRVLALISPPPPPHTPTSELLITVLAERRRRATGPPPVPVSAPAPWAAPPPSGPSWSAPAGADAPFSPPG